MTNVKLSMDEIENFMNEKETIVYHELDSLGSIIEEGIKTRNRTITKKAYEYKMDGNRCLGKITKVIQDNEEILVEMDGLNNITKLGNMTYTYDYLNRLTRASGNGATTDYQYDELGNLYLKVKNGQATTFTYDNDKLLSYGGNTLVYDDHNRITTLGNMSLTWERDMLVSITNLGQTYTYEYDINGLRTKKTKGTSVTNYTYEGDLLVKQEDGTNKVLYLYDENSMLYGLIWNDEKYFYKRNLIGEISDIIDFNGNSVVKYSYDPFGKVESVTGSKASTLGVINSMLYKGYYYDVETQLYWVSSRYYSPELCRWISPDSIEYLDPESINGLNLYAYCGNDPVNYYDPSGHFAISALIIGAIIGAAVGFGTAAYIDYQDDGQIFNGSVKWYEYLGATVLGGVIGAGLVAFASMSFSATIPTGFAMVQTSAGTTAIVVTSSLTLTASGAQILAAAGVLGATYMFTKTIVDEGGVRITHNYPDDHGSPVHVHVSSDSGMTRVGPNGYPLNGDRVLSHTENKIFWRNIKKIRKIIKKLQKIIRRLPW